MIRWDAHICLPLHPRADFAPVDALRAAGVHYVSINVGADMNPLAQVMSSIAGFRATIAAHPERYLQANGVADIRLAEATGRIAVGFDLEGALPLMEQPEMIAVYRELGVRQILLAYNRNNSVADGCHDAERGLTALGRRMVGAANEAGVLLDCTHGGHRCSLDIMAASGAPVVFSHSNPRALVGHGRNISDEQIRACAATGGVVCITGISFCLGASAPDAADIARHAAYVADLVGVAHAGIGLDICFSQAELDDAPPDFDPGHWWPPSAGYEPASPPVFPPVAVWTRLEAALRDVGMTQAEAAQVMGGNMLAVAERVWR